LRASLPDEVAEFLREHGPATASAVAMGIRARRDDVDAALTGARFCRVQRPEGASPRAVYFSLSPRVQYFRGGKSRAAAMLDVLRDGKRHDRDEIFRLAGRFFLTNNAAAELRKAGYDVRSGYQGENVVVYWLNAPAVKTVEAKAGATISGRAEAVAA
jgi:hypothetical protein